MRRSTSTSSWRSASALPRRRPDAVTASTTAVIAAAGSGLRLGAGGPKALAALGGRPMLAWSLEAFAGAEAISEIAVAAPAGQEGEIEALAQAVDRPVRVVPGGETRAQSVALAFAGAGGELVAVHDAARPLIGAGDIEMLVAELLDRPDADGVIAAAPLTDTVKRAREPRPSKGEFPRGGPTVAKTESRDHLWRAETPQVFRAEALRGALEEASPDRLREATDEAMLVEKAGGKVLMREVGGPNLKVTSADDLQLAELLLSGRS